MAVVYKPYQNLVVLLRTRKEKKVAVKTVQTGGKVKISVGLEANESDVSCFYCIFSSELETSQATMTATV